MFTLKAEKRPSTLCREPTRSPTVRHTLLLLASSGEESTGCAAAAAEEAAGAVIEERLRPEKSREGGLGLRKAQPLKRSARMALIAVLHLLAAPTRITVAAAPRELSPP